jgi:trafficking protein particle complex subunit 8
LTADIPNSPIDTDKSFIDEQVESIEHPLSSSETLIGNDTENVPLPIRKVSNASLKRHGQCLALSDHDRIKTFISEYLQRGLVPYAERTIKILNEQIQSKKSILKSFNIPRRIFGSSNSSSNVISSSNKSNQQSPIVAISTSGLTSSNPSSNGMSSNGLVTITSNFVATNDEFQLRRLADLAFMFRLYDLAYTSYHSCKKDFSNFLTNQSNSEQLLSMNFYLAGSLEMASISNFMQQYANDLNSSSTMPSSSSSSSLSSLSSSSIKSYNSQYIEDATHLLLNTCKSSYFSTRAILLSTEALRANSSFLRAAFQFINFPSDDADIRSGLFLEQAAQCYLAQPQPLIRKYAFFMSLAGHRFNQVGQKKHALRVYKHALDIYESRQWFRAQDHIHFVMSRLNFNLKDMNEALHHILEILVKKTKSKKKHEVHDFSNETNVLKDFILYSNTLNKDACNKLTNIPVPLIDYVNVKVNLAPCLSDTNLKFGKILVKNEYGHGYIEESFGALTEKLNGNLFQKNYLQKY